MDDEGRLGLAPRGYGFANAELTLPLPGEQDDYRNYHSHKYSKKNWNQQLQQPGSGAQPPSQTLSSAPFEGSIHPQSDLVEAPQLLQLDPSQSHQQQAHQQHQNQNQQRLVRPSPPPFQHVNLPAGHPHPHSHLHVHPTQPPQPYHHPSQPPRLPPLAVSLSSISISPFDPFNTREGGNYFLSSTVSPALAPPNATLSSIPRLPAQADDIVSPISETRSSIPALRSLDRGNDRITHSPAAVPLTRFTPSTLRRQPTPDSLAGISLLDDKDFELSLGATGRSDRSATSVSRFASAAVTSVVAHDVAHLTTDERSDDWFKFTAPESTISSYTNPYPEAHKMMTVAMAADRSSVPEQQQQSAQFAAATSSFTPLPPIRRTSTFDLLRKKGLVNDDSDTSPSPIERDIPPAVSPVHADAAQQTSNGQLSAGQSASDSSPHSSAQPHSQQNLNLHGQSQPPMPQHPNGLVAAGPAGQTGTSQYPIVMQMHPHQMIMGRNGPASQQVAPGQMMINGQVQTIISGGRQWIVQESHLAEPLHPSNRNRSANSPQSYSAYDKETEGEGGPLPPPGAASSQPPPTRPRNTSNTVPPTTAMRYPTLFPPASSAEQHPFQRQQGQVPLPQHPLLRGQNSSVGPRDIFDDRSSKDMGVRVDQVSVSSIASEEVNDKPRRGSGSLFSMGHRRNSSSATAAQQGPSDGQPEKKKNFFASVTGISHHSQPKPKSNLGLTKTSTFDESDQVSLQNPGDNVPVKKRLSELKGMIKGVGNAKEGAKDDQPVKVETIYESRQSLQGPPRNNPAPTAIQGAQRQAGPFGPHAQPGQFGPQGQPNPYGLKASMQVHPSQMGQPVTMSPAAFNGIGRAATAGPQSGHIQQVKSEESGKKGSASGFLGGLFNKQANKTKEIKSQSPQQRPPSSQRPTQPPSMQPSHLPFSAKQMHLPGQHIGPHPMFAGQPPFQRGPPGQSPSPTLFQDPTQPPPSLQTAQVVTIRRPSEITVSTQGTQQPSNQRPNMPSPQGSQGTFKQHPGSSPLGQRSSQMGPQNDGNIVASQTSPQLSDKSSREQLTIGVPSTITRISPNRKPVGSANFKGDGPFMTSAISPSVVRPERSTASPSPRTSEQQRAPSQLSQARQSPQLASFGVSTDMRQPSLPSPVPSLVPSQSNHSSSPRLQGDQFARDSPEQGLGVFPNGISQPGPMNASGPGGAPNALVWGPNGFRPAAPALAPPSAAARIQPPLAPSSPVPSMDQSKLSKFFGAYDGGKPAAQPQPQPQANKEKSAASKFLGAFKRSSKHNEASQPQQRPQTSLQIPQSAIRPGAPGPADSGAMPNPGSIPGSSGAPMGQSVGQMQPGQGRGQVQLQVAARQMEAGRGQPGQIPPHMIPMQGQAGRGQIPPGMILGARRGQPPPMFAGARPLAPQMQHPGAAGQRGNEPKYDQVPIPRGYEAVHGYGPGGMLAPSPYNAGRPGLPPMQYAQYPPTMQPGFPPRQWDPRVMQPSQAGLPLGATPGNPQPVSQGLPNAIPHQGPLQHPQLQGSTQNPSPNTQNLHLSPSQIQLSPQQFPQSQSAQESRRLSAPGQGQIPTQRAPSVQLQQTQSHGQGSQQGSSPASQAQSNVNWKGTPEKTQSPASVRQPNPPASNSVPQSSVQATPVSGSPASNGTPPPQSQHIAATVPSQPPQLVQANPARQISPVNQITNAPTQVPVVSSQGQYDVQSPRSTAPTGGFLRSPDATRLTSRMSVSRQSIKSASPSTEKLADRTMSVSPEPPGPRHAPLHQVSEQNLSVNVERANSHAREGSEDIYDATPRLNNSKFQGEDQAHENTKYAGSEKSRVVTNGAAVAAGAAAGAGAGASSGSGSGSGTVTEDNMSFLDGPDDSEPDDSHAAEESKGEDLTISPPQRTATMNMEPEEKILVDEPVELAAVNDDDDGIPMMTATSYPGQEWNPYGAGEFGDWE